MNRRTWKEFITKRSTIWTLSLCLVGAIVLGGMAAVNSSRNSGDTQTETELGQIAYLEENLDGESTNDEDADINTDNSENDAFTTDSVVNSSTTADDTADNSSDDATDVSTDLILGDESGTDTSDSGSAEASPNVTDDVTDTGESADDAASSANASADDIASADDTASGTDASADGTASGTDSSAEDVISDSTGTSDAVSSDSEEASSANIISEQALIDAGVSFTDDQSLLWPSAGTIAIDYSMDKSVYFATLNQYKYNPALVISSDTGNQVLAAAKGIVESISIDEETGTTLVLNLGNGYRLTYGQLMEPAVSEGDVVEAGDLLAYISEPTKYYSTEGSNLYFAMTKDGEPVDPVLYLE